MPVTHAKERTSGLITIALAVALMSAPAAYTRPSDASLAGLSVTGSAGAYAGTTIAMPVSGAE